MMHVVESFSGGVAHSIRTAVEAYCADLPGIIVYGPRDFDGTRFHFHPNVTLVPWDVTREVGPSDFNALLSLIRIIRDQKPTVVHAHSSKAGLHARIACTLLGVPCLYTPHSYSFLRSDVSPFSRSLYTGIEFVAARFGYTIACGLEEASLARRLGGKSTVVENGVDLSVFGQRRAVAGRSDGPFTFVAIGRVSPQKDYGFFERVCSSPELGSCRFIWITGEPGGDRQPSANVWLLGERSPNEVASILRNADCFINTSLWEGLSRAVIEAAAVGLPLLLRDSPGNRELIFRGVQGAAFKTIHEAVLSALAVIQRCEADPAYGRGNVDLIAKFYDARKTQSRLRSIYDALAFDRLGLVTPGALQAIETPPQSPGFQVGIPSGPTDNSPIRLASFGYNEQKD
jgi:glycosyltransferase involved in cell wall biosynthesis